MKQLLLKECSGGATAVQTPAQPTQPAMEFELVAEEAQIRDGWGNQIGAFGHAVIDGQLYRLDRMYRIKGTNMFVMGSSKMQ